MLAHVYIWALVLFIFSPGFSPPQMEIKQESHISLLHTHRDARCSLSAFLPPSLGLHSLSNYLESERLVPLHCVSGLLADHNI